MPSKFNAIMRDAQHGTVVKPLLHSYLLDAKWTSDFAITFKKGPTSRKPDGWFHPSEHPSWQARQLYYLITQPDDLDAELLEYKSTLAVTVGTAMHGFIEMCLKDIGILLGPERLRELGFQVHPKSGEPAVSDPEAGSRGHMDGVLEIFLPDFPKEPYPLFEFKTSNENVLRKIEDLDLEAFIRMFPEYYAQAQEYLRMSGRSVSVVLFMQMGFPWTLKEFHIPANPRYQRGVQMKYLQVRKAVEEGELPEACCGPGSKEAKSCPARGICPIGQITVRR